MTVFYSTIAFVALVLLGVYKKKDEKAVTKADEARNSIYLILFLAILIYAVTVAFLTRG